MQFRRVIDYLEGICILHNDPGIAQNLEITEQKSELTITNLTVYILYIPTHLTVPKPKDWTLDFSSQFLQSSFQLW